MVQGMPRLVPVLRRYHPSQKCWSSMQTWNAQFIRAKWTTPYQPGLLQPPIHTNHRWQRLLYAERILPFTTVVLTACSYCSRVLFDSVCSYPQLTQYSQPFLLTLLPLSVSIATLRGTGIFGILSDTTAEVNVSSLDIARTGLTRNTYR